MMMMQYAVARPPPPGFFGPRPSCARQAVDDVPLRRRPPPGFFRPMTMRALPPSPRELPVPTKFLKRAAQPVSHAAAAEMHPTRKRQRLCSDYEDDIDANLRATEKNAQCRL